MMIHKRSRSIGNGNSSKIINKQQQKEEEKKQWPVPDCITCEAISKFYEFELNYKRGCFPDALVRYFFKTTL
jgi:hypothetical protein